MAKGKKTQVAHERMTAFRQTHMRRGPSPAEKEGRAAPEGRRVQHCYFAGSLLRNQASVSARADEAADPRTARPGVTTA